MRHLGMSSSRTPRCARRGVRAGGASIPAGAERRGSRQSGATEDRNRTFERPGDGRRHGQAAAPRRGHWRPRRGWTRGQMEQQARSVTTDADGRWELRGLPAGRYNVTVSKGGYLTVQYGQKRPFEQGKLLDLADGQVLEKIDVSLPKGSVIAGRLLDEFGDPATPAIVVAMRHRYVDGQRVLLPVGDDGFMSMLLNGGLTDDTGEYRLHGLPPGTYYLSAMFGSMAPGRSDDRTMYAPTFYPGTPSIAEAQRITVGVGQETRNITFNLTTVRVARITRHRRQLLRPTGQSIGQADVRDAWRALGRTGIRVSRARTAPSRSRTCRQVITGCRPRHHPDSLPAPELASIPITVDGQDITGVAIATAPGATASGRVLFEGAHGVGRAACQLLDHHCPDGGRIRVGRFSRAAHRTHPRPGDIRAARVVGAPRVPDCLSASRLAVEVRHAGRHGHHRLRHRFQARTKRHRGSRSCSRRARRRSPARVQDDRGRPLTDYAVVAFSPDSSKWGYQTRFVRSARPNQDGRFDLEGLPPGDYLVAALEYLEAWR